MRWDYLLDDESFTFFLAGGFVPPAFLGEYMSSPDYLMRSKKEINGEEKWIDMGIAYRNAKGTITVYLTALPMNDRIFLIPVRRG